MPFYNVILFIFLLSTSFFLLLVIPYPWNIAIFTACLLMDISILRNRLRRKAEEALCSEEEDSD
jgi:hypothetical protein